MNSRILSTFWSSTTLLMLAGTASADALTAKARMLSCADTSLAVGTATLSEAPSEEGVKLVDVFINLKRGTLTPGKHAFHIHEVGTCEPCTAAGGHFDPGPAGNSSPEGNHPFHAGDLVNVEVAEDGSAVLFAQTSRITLSPGPLSVFDADGSAFIVHEAADTYCPDGEVVGCAGGARVACGVIKAR